MAEEHDRSMMENLYWWGIPTFFRCPNTQAGENDIALVGVPHSTGNGTTERDQHLGPRAVRNVSAMQRRIHGVFGIDPWNAAKVVDVGDVPLPRANDNEDCIDRIEAFYRDGSITIETLTNSHTILVLAGPKSRDVLTVAVPDVDWSQSAFPWLSVQNVAIGAADVVAMSVSFSGELAWELHIPNDHLLPTFQALWAAGQANGIRPFGLRATESMRIEKGYRHWKSDLITEFNPFESALDRFVTLDKAFVGKDALVKMHNQGPRRKFISLEIKSGDAPAHPGDTMLANGRVIGTVTSSAFGHRLKKNLAMGFVDPGFSEAGSEIGVEILGSVIPAEVCADCLYDPGHQRVRN